MVQQFDAPDSYRRLGGIIPGTPGIHAYSASGVMPSAIPVLIAVPHAGRAYPDSLLRVLRDAEATALRLEDRLVDGIAAAIARQTGASLLVANAPRAMIDLNRAPEDIDWEMFGLDDRPDASRSRASHRARSGLGLIPRRVPGVGELWKRPHRADELVARIAGIHAPYHREICETLGALRERWGAALLIDLHSMPPMAPQPGGSPPPHYVLGDRFGASCDARIAASISAYLHRHQSPCAHNRPYAGGHVLDRHGDPARGINAVQIEIDRSLYLDSGLSRLGEGSARVIRLLAGMVRHLATQITRLDSDPQAQGWRDAAE